ncbi:MAG TPA: exo-alpha-sialidase [Bryobacteraceae bacterium]|nr:exo-alpha-sialidase [Bryobacteraceae bacterium]
MRTIAVCLFSLTCALGAPQHSSELIFPLEHWHNHSSSVVELPNGDLLVCWFHGSGERTADDVLISGARWNRSTGKWTAPFTMADTPGFPETNPVLFLDSHRRLFFLWPLIIAHRWETALMKYRISTDYQQASGPPHWEFQDNIVLIPKNIVERTKELAGKEAAGSGPMAERAKRLIEHSEDEYFSRMGWFTRTHPIELPSGRILVPMYSDGFSFGIMAISDDGGYTWNASEPIVGIGGVQPSVIRKNDGTLVAFLRDNGPPPKRAQISFSQDDGVTWTPARDTEIPNPGTSLEAVRLRDGNWILVYNDIEQDRYSLVAALSDDEGATWKWKRHLDGRPTAAVVSQYHYPSVIQAKDGAIHVTYSYFVAEGKSIKHARFDEDWIKAGDSGEER